MNQYIGKILTVTFVCMMSAILFLLWFFQTWDYSYKREYTIPNYAILGIELLIFCIICYICMRRKATALNLEKMDKLIYLIGGGLFVVQIYISHNILFYTGWDVGGIVSAAQAIAEENMPALSELHNYFSRCPNNLFITIIEANLFRLNNSFGMYQGTTELMPVVVVNCALSSIAVVLIYKILRLWVNRTCALGGCTRHCSFCAFAMDDNLLFGCHGIDFPYSYFLFICKRKPGGKQAV